MTQEAHRKRRHGGQAKPPAQLKRNNLSFRTRAGLRERLEKAAAAGGRSVSEEIEHRLLRDFGWEATKADIDEMKARAAAWENSARIGAIRAAGLQILREISGRPTQVIIDLETLLAEADGLARGLRSGFFDKPQPARDEPRPMTPEEAQRALEEIEKIKRMLEAAANPGDAAA